MKFKNLILDFDIDFEEVKSTFGIVRKKTHIDLTARAASHNRLLYIQRIIRAL